MHMFSFLSCHGGDDHFMSIWFRNLKSNFGFLFRCSLDCCWSLHGCRRRQTAFSSSLLHFYKVGARRWDERRTITAVRLRCRMVGKEVPPCVQPQGTRPAQPCLGQNTQPLLDARRQALLAAPQDGEEPQRCKALIPKDKKGTSGHRK